VKARSGVVVYRNVAGQSAVTIPDNPLEARLPEARKALKKFPCISDPSADKILLFTKTAPISAVPSNRVHVPLRLGLGEGKKPLFVLEIPELQA